MRINGTETSIQLMHFDLIFTQKISLHCIYVLANNSDPHTHPFIRDRDSTKGLWTSDPLGIYKQLSKGTKKYSNIQMKSWNNIIASKLKTKFQ